MQVRKTYYNDSQMTDMNSLTRALMSRPAELSPAITFLGGREDKKFPLTMLTEGAGNVKSLDKFEYEYRIQQRVLQVRPVNATPAVTANLGIGGSVFELEFPDAWFIYPYTLVSESGVQARIMAQPEQTGNGYKYKLKLINPSPSATMPSSDVQAGKLFGMLWASVGTDFSRGNASNWSSPGMIRHKFGTIRKSYQMSGNAKDFVAEFKLPSKNGGTTNMWMDYEEWQKMLQWKQESELLYWYGEKTYDANGEVQMKDENGQPVTVGPGLFQQIINNDTFSTLTENKLKNIVGDLYYGMTDADNMQVTLYTGTGGMRDFDDAMKNALADKSYIKLDNGQFVTGSGRNLTLGGYFTTYQHIDGHVINVVKVPMFDHGPIADSRAKHPVTGFSMESHRMVFVDQSRYDGEANVQMVQKKGREFLRWAVAGSVVPPGFSGGDLRASDIDGASVHFLKTGGIVLKRFDTSLDLQCIAN